MEIFNKELLYSIILVIGFVFSYSMPHLKDRKNLLFFNVIANFFFAYYFFLVDANAGMIASIIALISSTIQMTFSYGEIDKTAKLRFFMALVMSIIAIITGCNNNTDILPLIAVVIVRMAEAQKSVFLIKCSNIVPIILWIIYTYTNDLYLAFAGDSLLLLSYIWGIYRTRPKNIIIPNKNCTDYRK